MRAMRLATIPVMKQDKSNSTLVCFHVLTNSKVVTRALELLVETQKFAMEKRLAMEVEDA